MGDTAPAARSGGASSLQTFALLALGLILIHHIRYLFARFSGPEEIHQEQVHAYLPFALMLVLVLFALAVLLVLRDVVGAHRTGVLVPYRPPSFRLAWLQNSVLLAGCYVLQETIEHRVGGEPIAIGGILLSRDGWIVLPLALAFGGLVALILRGARAIVRVVRRGCLVQVGARAVSSRWPWEGVRPAQFTLLGSIAGRAPPSCS
jgi:hypothetical protein